MSTPAPASAPSTARKAVVAASVGNALEWFDIIVFGFFAVEISTVFFPSDEGAVGLIKTFSFVAISFLVRPVGALVLGRFADRHGRKPALTLTIGLMTLGVAMLALAPTPDLIGVLAPVWLLVARLLQGFSAGGEFGSATAFLTEHASDRPYRAASWQVTTQGVSMLLAGTFGWALHAFLTEEQVLSWGWRVPFAFGLLIGPVGWYIRQSLPDTPAFETMQRSHTPYTDVLARWGTVLTAAACVGTATISVYLITYLPTFAMTNLDLPSWSGYLGAMVAGVVTIVLTPIIGSLAERIGPVRVMLPAAIAGVVLGIPMFLAMVAWPSVAALIALELLLGVLMATYFAPLPGLLAALFEPQIRSLGLATSYNLGVTLLGGFAPMILAALVSAVALQAPGFYYAAICLVSVVGLVFARPRLTRR